jgi:hypothetical protein
MDSTNPGFFLRENEGKIRVGGKVGRLSADNSPILTAEIGDGAALAVVQAIVRDYRYLLGDTR